MKLSEYRKIKDELINSAFPSLKEIKIHVLKFFGFGFSARADKEFFGYTIWINPFYQIYDKVEIKGLLAHELCHIEDWVVNGDKWRRENNKLCRKSRDYNKKYEKATDNRVISEKGFGEELKKQREKREIEKDRNYKRFKDMYYSSKEIEEKLKLIKSANPTKTLN